MHTSIWPTSPSRYTVPSHQKVILCPILFTCSPTPRGNCCCNFSTIKLWWSCPVWGCYESYCNEHSYTCLSVNIWMHFCWVYTRESKSWVMGIHMRSSHRYPPNSFSQWGVAVDPPSGSVSYSCSTSLPTLGITSFPHFSHSCECSVELYYGFNFALPW